MFNLKITQINNVLTSNMSFYFTLKSILEKTEKYSRTNEIFEFLTLEALSLLFVLLFMYVLLCFV